MSRPTASCAKCERDYRKRLIDSEALAKCEHLMNTWDHFALKTHGTTLLTHEQEADIMAQLRDYALNRMLALDRDNGNKAEGKPASKIYRSRNEKTARALANLCGFVGPRGFRCIKAPHPSDPDSHKF